jgi:ABC-type methionine transport system permease subunit
MPILVTAVIRLYTRSKVGGSHGGDTLGDTAYSGGVSTFPKNVLSSSLGSEIMPRKQNSACLATILS